MAIYLVPVFITETVEKTGIARVEADSVEQAEALAREHQALEIVSEKVLECLDWSISDVLTDEIKEEGGKE